MLVADVMTGEVFTCAEDATARDALAEMWRGDVGALPIVDHANQVLGMVTDRDIAMAGLIRGVPPHRIPVMAVTTQVVWHVNPQDTLEHAEEVMEDHQIRRLPVVEGNTLVGMLTLSDLVRARSGGVLHYEVARTLAAITTPRVRAQSVA